MIKAILILFTVVGLLTSCKLSRKTNIEIESCINENIKTSFNQTNAFEHKGQIIHLSSNFNLFDSLKKVENKIFSEYKLIDFNKKNYKKIHKNGIKKITEETTPFMKSLIETPGPTTRYPWDLCFRVPLSQKFNLHSNKIITILDNVMINGGFNNQLIESLIEAIDYKSDTERNILLYCIYLNEFYDI